jgi:hypothetical protein
MTRKTVVVAHRVPGVRERFASALETAGHRVVCVGDEPGLADALARETGLALALVDATLVAHGPEAMAAAAPTVVFAGSVADAAAARAWARAGARGWVNEHSAPHQVLSSLAPLLFRDSFDRRASPRVPVAMPVSCTAGSAVSSATALNVGAGGLALRPLTAVPVGEVVRLRFRLPALARDIDVEARVCWSDLRYGIGVQVERISEQDGAALEAFVERHLPGA